MKIVEITDRTDLFALVATLEAGEDEVVIARDGRPVARLSKITPIVRSPGILCASPAWQDYHYDPALFAALETDDQLAAEGWPV